MTASSKSQDAPALPAAGGSYTRKPDGGLDRTPAPKKPKRKSPVKPTVKEA